MGYEIHDGREAAKTALEVAKRQQTPPYFTVFSSGGEGIGGWGYELGSVTAVRTPRRSSRFFAGIRG